MKKTTVSYLNYSSWRLVMLLGGFLLAMPLVQSVSAQQSSREQAENSQAIQRKDEKKGSSRFSGLADFLRGGGNQNQPDPDDLDSEETD
ncbi:MAG: hypothetical protein F6K42_33405 [Leptolyngbya sp. SIO1D8]|nr:hypothetical protein [Leptolyngbya sp. SIO1D8]